MSDTTTPKDELWWENIQEIIWMIDEGPAHPKCTEAIEALKELRKEIAERERKARENMAMHEMELIKAREETARKAVYYAINHRWVENSFETDRFRAAIMDAAKGEE